MSSFLPLPVPPPLHWHWWIMASLLICVALTNTITLSLLECSFCWYDLTINWWWFFFPCGKKILLPWCHTWGSQEARHCLEPEVLDFSKVVASCVFQTMFLNTIAIKAQKGILEILNFLCKHSLAKSYFKCPPGVLWGQLLLGNLSEENSLISVIWVYNLLTFW